MRTIIVVLICLLFGQTGASAQSKRPLQNLDIFELEYAADPQIAPHDGLIAYVRRSNDIMTDRTRNNIWTVNSDGSSHRPLLSGRANFTSPRWSPTGDRLAYIATAGDGSPQLFVRWTDTGQTALLTNLIETPQSIAWSPNGDELAFSMFVETKNEPLAKAPAKPKGADWADPVIVVDDVYYRRDGAGYLRSGFTHIFVVPADGGTPRQLTSGDYNHNGPLEWSVDGSSIYFSANRSQDWELDPLESDLWRISVNEKTLTRLTNRDGPDNNPSVSPDGSKIAFLGFDDNLKGYHNSRAHVMDSDGGNVSVLTTDFDRSISSIAWANNSELIVQYDDHGRTLLAQLTLDGTLTPLVRDVGGTTLGRPYTSGGFDVSDEGEIAYTTGRASRPSDIAFRENDQAAIRLTRLNDDLFQDIELGSVERVTWSSSADGREIEGWLVKPPNFDVNEKYPLILEIHGGPFAAYGPQFSGEVQLYAAAGYVVLYTNPRGSTSYGDAFANLIHHAYPGQDYDDLVSGVDAVIDMGIVDPDNLFVTGGSGGGVLTAWIIGNTNRFKAAVVAKPVINWTSFVLTADLYPLFTRYWFSALPWEDPEAYWDRSPLSLVGNVTTPTMLLTGEADHRTPISETEQYYQALKLRGVDTAMVRVPGSPHGIAGRPSNLIGKVDNIVAWFERYRD